MEQSTRRQIVEAIELAAMAPSTHNTQPWRFEIHETSVLLKPDVSRKLEVLDPLNRELHISLGCALENLVIALDHFGYGTEVELFPRGPEPDAILVQFHAREESHFSHALFEAIAARRTNRNAFDPTPLPSEEMERLRSVPLEPGVTLHLTDERRKKARVIQLVMDADEIQMRGGRFKEELSHWIRFNTAEQRRRRDGLGNEAIGIPAGPRWLGRFFLDHFDVAETRAERDRELLESSPAIAVFSTMEDNKYAWVAAGRSFERVALSATANHIQHAHMNQPIEIPDMRWEVGQALKVPLQYPQLLIRMGYAQLAPHSLRRPVEEIIDETLTTLLPGRMVG